MDPKLEKKEKKKGGKEREKEREEDRKEKKERIQCWYTYQYRYWYVCVEMISEPFDRKGDPFHSLFDSLFGNAFAATRYYIVALQSCTVARAFVTNKQNCRTAKVEDTPLTPFAFLSSSQVPDPVCHE